MGHFSYSFCISLLHSLWQSALLLVFYFAVQGILRKQPPALKRNFLFGLLFIQFFLTIITFSIYYSGYITHYTHFIEENFSILLQQQDLLIGLTPWLTLAYLAILMGKTIIMSVGWYRFKKACKASAVKAPVELRLFLNRHAQAFGITRKVSLWVSEKISTPLTFGFWKPVIILPFSLLAQLDMRSTESLIIHELTHIKNNDYLLNWFLIAMHAIFFFNPFVAILGSRIKLEREKNCDVQVLQFRYAALEYAQTLLTAAKHKRKFNHFSLAAVFRNKQLLQRIKFFTAEPNMVFLKARSQRIVMPLMTIAVLANLAIMANLGVLKLSKNVKETPASTVYQLPGTEEFPAAFAASNDPMPAPLDAPSPKVITTRSIAKPAPQPASKVSKEAIADVDISEFTAMAARYAAEAAAVEQQKQLIIEEQASGTAESIRKTYALQLENGEWKKQLLYTIKVGKLTLDSLTKLQDSLIYELPVPMQ